MIRGFSGERTPAKNIVATDFEWYPGTYKFRLGGIYDGEMYEWYESAEELLQALCSPKYRGAYIYSHFGGAADEQFLLEPWLRGRFKVEGSFSGGSMVFAKVSRKKNTWYFLDSYWTLRRPLAEIATSVGLKKLGEDYKCPGYCAHDPKLACIFYAPIAILRDYNEADCVVLHTAMSRFQDEIRELGGQLRATAASTALDLFRRVYLDGSVKTVPWVNDFAYQSYIASRVEVIRPHCAGPAWFYDVNSSFPWSMTQPYPGNLMRTTKRWNGEEMALIDATVEVPEMHIPPLGFRGDDGAVYHPTGRWRDNFTGIDLKALEEVSGKIITVHRTLLFEARTELAAYVHELYERRRTETDPFRREIYKLLMNSLYGKFGEQCQKKMMTIDGGKITMTEKTKYVPHRWVPISATITARSRQLLGKYLREAGDVYYCDSVTGDRPIIVQDPNGRTKISLASELWDASENRHAHHTTKEAGLLPGWSALGRGSRGDAFYPIKQVIRHRADKPTQRLSTKHGQAHVTLDHSLMVGGKRCAPAQFIENKECFDICAPSAPRNASKRIDLLEHVVGFEADPDDKDRIRLPRKTKGQYVGAQSDVRILRFYEPGSKPWMALLRLTAAYVCDGSASTKATTQTRHMLSFCKANLDLQNQLADDLRTIAKGMTVTGPLWSDTTYVVRSGTTAMALLFASLAGQKSKNKFFPSYVFDLSADGAALVKDGLEKGDGSIDAAGQICFTTTSAKLAAGVSYFLAQHGWTAGFYFRPSKRSWMIRTIGTQARNRYAIYTEDFAPEGWVYDLSVEDAETFVDGIGRVLLHNTDSVATTNPNMKTGDKIGELKKEKTIEKQAVFYRPKLYKVDDKNVKAKGFSRLSSEAFDSLMAGEPVEVTRMRRIREKIAEMVRNGDIMDDGTVNYADPLHPCDGSYTKKLSLDLRPKRAICGPNETRPWTVGELTKKRKLPT